MRIILLIGLLFFTSCEKQNIDASDVISDLSLIPVTIEADGSSMISISVKLNKEAEVSKRKVVFETSSGSFASTNTKTATIEATYEQGLLVARTSIKAPTSPGVMFVTARTEYRSLYNDFIAKGSITIMPSVPVSIKAEPSSFGVRTDFLGEVEISGILKNANGRNVSTGSKVVFEDYFPGQNVSANGRYRLIQVSSDENSRVNVLYSPGHVTPGTPVFVKCTLLDSAGNKTNIKDSVLLTVIP